MLEYKRLSDLVFGGITIERNRPMIHDYESIGVSSQWNVDGDGTPPPDLDIESFEQIFSENGGGETSMENDFGLGLSRSTPANLNTFGLA